MTATELIPAPAAGEILLPADTDAVQQAMRAYLEVTRAVLDPTDWQGPPDETGSFVKKSGWQKIAKAYRLSTEIVSTDAERDDAGLILRAECVVRAIAPNGQHREATGYCATTEPRFERASGRHKLENDLRNTAATRAENRAISNLCGFGAVSAEEVGQGAGDDGHTNGPAGTLPHWAQPGEVPTAAHLLTRILEAAGAEHDRVSPIGNELFGLCDESIPTCVVAALDLIVGALPEAISDAEVEVEP